MPVLVLLKIYRDRNTRLASAALPLPRHLRRRVAYGWSIIVNALGLGSARSTNKRRTSWLSCSAPLTQGIPASIFAIVHGLWMQDAARIRGHFCSFGLDVMSDYGTDHRLNDRYTLCDHGWLLHNHRFDNCVKHDDFGQLSSSSKRAFEVT